MMILQVDDIEALMAFIKRHERKDIPDDVWHLYKNVLCTCSVG